MISQYRCIAHCWECTPAGEQAAHPPALALAAAGAKLVGGLQLPEQGGSIRPGLIAGRRAVGGPGARGRRGLELVIDQHRIACM